LEKVASLIGLDPPQLDDGNIEEIPIDDALIEEEMPTQALPLQSPEKTVYEPGLLADTIQPYIDQQIAEETDAAFAAIGVGTDLRDTMPPRRPGLPGVAPRANSPFGQGPRPSAISPEPEEIELGFEDVVQTGGRLDGRPASGS